MSSPSQVTFRTMLPGEEDALGAFGWQVYKAGTPEGWVSYFALRPDATPKDRLVAEIDGEMAGILTLLDFRMSLLGEDVPVRGVAAVGVSPGFRRRGVGARLMQHAFAEMLSRGDGLSLLYPFKPSFYQAHGYGTVEWGDVIQARPQALPDSPQRRQVRTLSRALHDEEIRACYDRARRGGSGSLHRPDWWWENKVWGRASEGAVYRNPGSGRVEGYLFHKVPPVPDYPGQHLQVREWMAETPAAFRGLLGYLAALGEQFEIVEMCLPRDSTASLLTDYPLRGGILALDGEHHIACTRLAMGMARILHLETALAPHPGARGGSVHGLGLEVTDPDLPEMTGSYDVELGGDGPEVNRGDRCPERLSLSIDQLSQVVYGGASARTLLRQGWIQGSEVAAGALDERFGEVSVFLGGLNAF